MYNTKTIEFTNYFLFLTSSLGVRTVTLQHHTNKNAKTFPVDAAVETRKGFVIYTHEY